MSSFTGVKQGQGKAKEERFFDKKQDQKSAGYCQRGKLGGKQWQIRLNPAQQTGGPQDR